MTHKETLEMLRLERQAQRFHRRGRFLAYFIFFASVIMFMINLWFVYDSVTIVK